MIVTEPEVSMRIAELTAFHIHVPLRKAIQHASHTRTSTDNIVVRCILEDGTGGYGEGLPRDYVTGETIDASIGLLKQTDLGKQVHDCATLADALAMAEQLQVQPVPGDDRGIFGNAARCALELAILDAYLRYHAEPLEHVTQILAPELYVAHPRVQYSAAITATEGQKLRWAAWKYRLYGFRQIKVKVGIKGQNDFERLSTVRRRMGKAMDIRVDANEAWSAAEAVERIRELEPLGITSVEQPVAHEEVHQLGAIRTQVNTPIMLDESLCGMIDAKRAAELELCDLFNIRLSKCGGFIPSLRLAQFARQHGLGYQLGCQVGETGILSAAGRHFACSVADIRFLEGSYDRHLVKERLTREDLTFGWGGWAPALCGSGLGVTINTEALEQITRRKELLLG